MPRSTGTVVENNFSRGLITEATGLNFPENAATDADNAVFGHTGQVRRRQGIDIEAGAVYTEIQYTDQAVREYVWHAASLTGMMTFVVIQFGSKLHFWLREDDVALSAGIRSFDLDLMDYVLPDVLLEQVETKCVEMASGNGMLMIVHPFCDPVFVEYDESTDTIVKKRIRIKIRDLDGVETPNVGDAENPNTLSHKHWYNLKNQGWFKRVRMVKKGGGAAKL